MPTVLVVTGPSGAGKGTLIRELVERVPEIEVTVSATTRERRRGEEDGREYWFLSDDDFLARIARGEFLEQVEYVSGHRYGTLRSEPSSSPIPAHLRAWAPSSRPCARTSVLPYLTT